MSGKKIIDGLKEAIEHARGMSAPAPSLPDYGPARDMSTAPRDGRRILLDDPIDGQVTARWDTKGDKWLVSPGLDPLDGEPTGWWPLPTEQR